MVTPPFPLGVGPFSKLAEAGPVRMEEMLAALLGSGATVKAAGVEAAVPGAWRATCSMATSRAAN